MSAPGVAVLLIGGADPSGGAGIELDARVVFSLGVHPLSVATALTVQDSEKVFDVIPLGPADVARRITIAVNDIAPSAIKLGMLGDGPTARAVAEAVASLDVPLVIDPVIRSSSGAVLTDDEGIAILRDTLIPMAHAVTPNQVEASLLVEAATSAETRARALSELGPPVVIVTGGDVIEPDVSDVVVLAGAASVHTESRIRGASPHGTGCALATALAVRLALGDDDAAAVAFARKFVRHAIAGARSLSERGRPLLDVAGAARRMSDRTETGS